MFGFIRRASFDELQRQYDNLAVDHAKQVAQNRLVISQLDSLTDQWNDLVKKINRNGGQRFLDGHVRITMPFTKEELQKLIILCHPDKHDGKQMAKDMTHKLLELR